ncbi:hypothetical protein V6N12_011402 [Hibiscus sabdariffa]|uniref:Uncharacterized protein n=1 Tax=Hibiscus sabdariffa TaxID=183260 RepID=A0ABR2APR2_9ROSI
MNRPREGTRRTVRGEAGAGRHSLPKAGTLVAKGMSHKTNKHGATRSGYQQRRLTLHKEGRYGAGGETTHMGLQAMHERDEALRTPRSKPCTRRSQGARGRAWEAPQASINNHPAAEGQTGSWSYCIRKGVTCFANHRDADDTT